MKNCTYCGWSNYDDATECRHCEAAFLVSRGGSVYRVKRFGPERGRGVRRKGLLAIVIALGLKVYYGGGAFGVSIPWPIFDNPTLAGIREWLIPLLFFVGGCLYIIGFILSWI